MDKIVVCAGGTGGHVIPALSLCEQLNQAGYKSILFTDARGYRFCSETRVKVQLIPDIELKLHSLARSFINSIGISVALVCSWKRSKPKAVIGFGGIMSVIPLLIAKIMKIPSIAHEQNAVLGKANSLLAKMGCYVTSNFPMKPYETVATPVRYSVQKKAASVYDVTTDGNFIISVVGGSQGAAIFSNVVLEAMKIIPRKIRANFLLIQQALPEDIENLTKAYEDLGIKSVVSPFIHDMASILEKSNLVISRSGASTLNELSTIGRPAIVIPYPHAIYNHQYKNAEYFEDMGALWIIEEKRLTPKELANQIIDCINTKDRLKLAAINMLKLRRPNANNELKSYILSKI